MAKWRNDSMHSRTGSQSETVSEDKMAKDTKKEQPAKKKQAEAAEEVAAGKPARPRASFKGVVRLKEKFEKEVRPALMKEFELKNPMAVPRLEKIVVNMGVGEATQNAKLLDPAAAELAQITGQKPVITKAKKSIAAFKVREGMPIGIMVTLRGDSTKSFDGRGNYTLGLKDQLIFPEIDYAKVEKLKGMNVTIVTTAKTDDQARALLRGMGMPFRA